ncbi:transporter substrate-binding domain-containing protein [Bifidobacterium sp. LC6]|uniref:Transporter substrate-binding domain-containing protein n=1 Tax=Bifidobacterium colobi TaxID=2809026 RepID=A0ABS5UXV8_9BIFI|nr:transporter substrate-binding domain-containing protein [Bifidobacterium colobi]
MRAIAAACGMVLALSGCGQIQVTTVSGSPEGPTIAIGVAVDEPGLGMWHDGTYEGFDVTVAKYVAARLGYANKQIVFKQVRPETRQSMLDGGQVDMVVSSWPITEQSKTVVDFAGPYLTTGVGLLVRSRDRDAFADPQSADHVANIGNHVVCAVKGDEVAGMFRAQHADASIQERDSYAQCVTALQAGSADAIVSDLVLLHGLKQANGARYSAVLKDSGTVRYGIAVSKGTEELAGKIAQSLTDMIEHGSWSEAQAALQRQTGFAIRLGGSPAAIVSDDE